MGMVERTEYPRPQSHILDDTRRQKRQPSNDPFMFFLTSLLSKCFLNNLFFFSFSNCTFQFGNSVQFFFSVASLPSLPRSFLFLFFELHCLELCFEKNGWIFIFKRFSQDGSVFFFSPSPPLFNFFLIVLSYYPGEFVNPSQFVRVEV